MKILVVVATEGDLNIQLSGNKQNSIIGSIFFLRLIIAGTAACRVVKEMLLSDSVFPYFHTTSMNRIKPDVDVISDLLKAVLEAQPESSFIQSLLHQYQERGGLSKKQLQGLYDKAAKIKNIPVNKLATLEAVILKKPTRYKSALPPTEPLFTKDAETGQMLTAILAKYPQHKRVLFLQSKYDNNEVLSPAEKTELQKFSKLLS